MTDTDLQTRVAQLEGKMELLTSLLQPRYAAPPTGQGAAPIAPLIPPEVTDAITEMGKGNRVLTRHLNSVALELLADNIEPNVIARKIREGERVP